MKRQYTLAQLAELTKAEMVGDPHYIITGVETLDDAGPDDISFLANPKYREAMLRSKAGVICIDSASLLPQGKNGLISHEPSRIFQVIAETFLSAQCYTSGFKGIHPTAILHPTVTLGKEVDIGPYAVIDQKAVIGDQTRISSFVSIGSGVTIGAGCLLHSHVVIREGCQIGNRVILQPGAVIGSCGFGYTTDDKGKHSKLEQLGTVVIEDDVEVGANTTIDRARFKSTRIGRGTKIDNLVQIGHNALIGTDNIIIAQSGVAGSSKTGKNFILGAQAGVVGHVEVGDNVMIATRGGISKSIASPGKYAGGPVMPLAEYNRQQVHLRNIGDYVEKLEELEERLRQLESK